MKKSVAIVCLMLFCTGVGYTGVGKDLPEDSRRHRIYLLGGGGWTFSRMEGLCLEVGAEVRLFGNLHARLMVDYYNAQRRKLKDGVLIQHAWGFNLYGVYKARLTDTWNLYLKAGGHLTAFTNELHSFGIVFDTDESEKGISGGLGFDWQLGNRWAIYTEATVKYLLGSQPWLWLKTQMGFRLRIY